MYVFLTNCILIFFMDLVYDVKDVFCALFYIIKQYFLHISLGHLEGMSCLLFWDQIFFSVTTGFLQFPQSFFFSDISLLTFSFYKQICFLYIPFFIYLQVISVAGSKPYFNLNQISSTCTPVMLYVLPNRVSQDI